MYEYYDDYDDYPEGDYYDDASPSSRRRKRPRPYNRGKASAKVNSEVSGQ